MFEYNRYFQKNPFFRDISSFFFLFYFACWATFMVQIYSWHGTLTLPGKPRQDLDSMQATIVGCRTRSLSSSIVCIFSSFPCDLLEFSSFFFCHFPPFLVPFQTFFPAFAFERTMILVARAAYGATLVEIQSVHIILKILM